MSLSQTSIQTVKLFATSLGNYFMIEIGQIYAAGFRQNGISAEVLIDKVPSWNPPEGVVQIVVAPHEFFPLFLEPRLYRGEIQDVIQASYMLNMEQPFSPWFEIAYERSKSARGVIDFNQLAVQEYRKRGVFAIHAPLGYAECLEEGVDQFNPPEKAIDLLFLGSLTDKRSHFLSRNADFFNRHRSHLVVARIEKPRLFSTPGFYSDHKRNNLLRSSHILINVHAADNAYFEWARVLVAMANRSLVISETSECYEPLINREHLILVPLDEIAEACEYYLNHDAEREAIVNRAHSLITQELHAERLCQSLLAELEQRPQAAVRV